jgi:hypothetical protein
MVKDFDAQTKEKAAGRTRVLLLDGHSSHYTLPLLDYARANNIIILGYPPHCTHVLQGLDVVCFAKMKHEFRHEIQQFEDLHLRAVTKADFAGVFGRAFLRAFTPETVKAAFKATGVHPFNPDVITERKMAPSLPTSIKGTFPLPQTSPVRAIVAAMGAHPPTAFDLSPTNVPGPSRTIHASPETPSRRRDRDPNIDPDLDETPSKRMRLMYGTLASTSSGSILVSKARMTSAYPVTKPVLEALPELPQPDWSLLKEPEPSIYQTRDMLEARNKELTDNLRNSQMIIRARELIDQRQTAQLVIQHAHLTKLNQSLHAKENKKATDRTILFPGGFGRHLTDPEFGQQLAEQARRKAAEEAGKAQRASNREVQRVAKAAAEAEWKKKKEEYEEAMESWKAECLRLRAENVRVKDFPPKPRAPRRPKPAPEAPGSQPGPSSEAGDGTDDDRDDHD